MWEFVVALLIILVLLAIAWSNSPANKSSKALGGGKVKSKCDKCPHCPKKNKGTVNAIRKFCGFSKSSSEGFDGSYGISGEVDCSCGCRQAGATSSEITWGCS
jgi:hypothetical protein